MKKNNGGIFAKFMANSFKQQAQKTANKKAIERAKKIGDEMIASKQKAREDFLNKVLENAKEMNAAREDWDSMKVEGHDLTAEEVQEIDNTIDAILEQNNLKEE